VAEEGASQSASFDIAYEYSQTFYFALKVIHISTCDVDCPQVGISNLASVSFASALDDGAWGMFGKDQYHTSLATVAGPGAGATITDPPVRRTEWRQGADPVRKADEQPAGGDDDGDGAAGGAWPAERISTPFQLQKARDRTVSRVEPKLRKLFAAYLDAQRVAVLALLKRKLRKADDESDEAPASRVDLSEAEIRAAIERPLTSQMMDALEEGLDDGGKQMADAMRVDFLHPEEGVQEYLDERRTNLERVLEEDTARAVKDSLRAGYDKGETERQLLERIAESGSFAASRAQRIARTELHTATQAGAHQQMKAQGVEERQWLAAPDARPTHQEASGQVRKLDEPFEVGEAELMFPGDPDGGADYPEEVVNCRCVLLTKVRETSEEDLSALLDSLGIEADAAGAEGQVAEAASDLPPEVRSRIDAGDIAPLRVDAGRGRAVEYELGETKRSPGKLTVGPKAPKDDVQAGVKEHIAASVTTATDARGFHNARTLQGLPDVKGGEKAGAERQRAVALVSRAATGDRAGLEALVGQKLSDAAWRKYETVARNFWIGIGTKGPAPAKR